MRIPVLVAVLMASTMLAGCLSDRADTDSTATQITGGGSAPTMVGATAVGGKYVTGFAGTEPTLGIDTEGVIYMTAFRPTGNICDAGICPITQADPDPEGIDPEMSANAGAPIAIASFDQGQTWVDLGPDIVEGTRTHRETLDPYLYVDPDTGRVYLDDLIAGYGSFMSWTDDQGESWFSHAPPGGNPQANDHQTMVALPGNPQPSGFNTAAGRVDNPAELYPNTLVMCFNNVAYASCSSSFDGGLTWAPQVVVGGSEQSTDPSESYCSGQTGHLKADADGRAFLPSVECPTSTNSPLSGGVPSAPVVYVSEDYGLVWRKVVISDEHLALDHETSIAVDEAGNVYAVWIDDDYMLRFAVSTNHGYSWGDSVVVSGTNITAATLPTLAAGSEGKVAFSYAGMTAEGGNSNPNATRGVNHDPESPSYNPSNDVTWNTYMGVIYDALADDIVVETVATNDPETDPMVRGNCGLTRCPGTFDFHDLWIDSEGRPWASWIDACEGECNINETVGNNANVGFVATLRSGLSLRGDGMLEQLPAQAVIPGQEEDADNADA